MKDGRNALYFAAWKNHEKVVEYLLGQKSDPNKLGKVNLLKLN